MEHESNKSGGVMTFTRKQCKDRGEWLADRLHGIGGSDAACIVGMNPWRSSNDLWLEKTGRKEAADISDKEAVKYGLAAESSLRQLFKLDFPEYKVYYKKHELLINKRLPFLRCSPDGELTDPNKRKGILEIKTTSVLQSMQRELWNDRVPDNYFCQVMHSLLVTGYDFAILKAQLKTVWGKDIRLITRHYFFERKDYEADMRALLAAEIKFWGYVERKERPPLKLPPI
jgi:putative phage-type endonuclease